MDTRSDDALEQLARFVGQTPADAIPPAVLERTREILVDTLPVIAWGGPKLAAAGATVIERSADDGAMGLSAISRIGAVRRHAAAIDRLVSLGAIPAGKPVFFVGRGAGANAASRYADLLASATPGGSPIPTPSPAAGNPNTGTLTGISDKIFATSRFSAPRSAPAFPSSSCPQIQNIGAFH